jgi:hypothetical protein
LVVFVFVFVFVFCLVWFRLVFLFSILRHLNFQKSTSQQGEKIKYEKKKSCRYFKTVPNKENVT